MTTELTDEQKVIYEELTMAKKIAILLTQIGDDSTSRLFANMDVELVTDFSADLVRLENYDKPVATAVLEEFAALFQSNQYIVNGGFDYAKEILFKTFGADTAQSILNKLSKELNEAKSFNFLAKVKPEQLADFCLLYTSPSPRDS